ncbi:MAG TPA: DNA translocase FtsK [Anaerolineales bacterium]|nr:DNA translocase FtsK [Anaerolineales bacterium]
MKIGYTRAARMIERMEEEGIIGPPTEGSKPREVLDYGESDLFPDEDGD